MGMGAGRSGCTKAAAGKALRCARCAGSALFEHLQSHLPAVPQASLQNSSKQHRIVCQAVPHRRSLCFCSALRHDRLHPSNSVSGWPCRRHQQQGAHSWRKQCSWKKNSGGWVASGPAGKSSAARKCRLPLLHAAAGNCLLLSAAPPSPGRIAGKTERARRAQHSCLPSSAPARLVIRESVHWLGFRAGGTAAVGRRKATAAANGLRSSGSKHSCRRLLNQAFLALAPFQTSLHSLGRCGCAAAGGKPRGGRTGQRRQARTRNETRTRAMAHGEPCTCAHCTLGTAAGADWASPTRLQVKSTGA